VRQRGLTSRFRGKSSEAVTSRHVTAEVFALQGFQKNIADGLTALSLVKL